MPATLRIVERMLHIGLWHVRGLRRSRCINYIITVILLQAVQNLFEEYLYSKSIDFTWRSHREFDDPLLTNTEEVLPIEGTCPANKRDLTCLKFGLDPPKIQGFGMPSQPRGTFHEFHEPYYGNNQQPTTTNIQHTTTTTTTTTTNNKQQTTNNKQQTINNKQQPTSNNQQQPTNNKQQTTTNIQQPTTTNKQTNKQTNERTNKQTNKQTTNNQQPTTNNQQPQQQQQQQQEEAKRNWKDLKGIRAVFDPTWP